MDNRDKCQKAIRGLLFGLWKTLDKAQNNRRVYPQRCAQLGSVCPKGRWNGIKGQIHTYSVFALSGKNPSDGGQDFAARVKIERAAEQG